jgi:hypothetical protein
MSSAIVVELFDARFTVRYDAAGYVSRMSRWVVRPELAGGGLWRAIDPKGPTGRAVRAAADAKRAEAVR